MNERLSLEIAAAAAQRIAEFDEDYGSAKRKAAEQILGRRPSARDVLPDNAVIEQAVREYQALFQADTQPARVHALRETALAVMQWLPHLDLYLVGAAANGTANDYSEIYLQCYCESSKDVHIDVLNAGLDAEADEIANPFGRGRVERVSFIYRGETVHITCYPPNLARQIGHQAGERWNATALQAWLNDPAGEITR